MRGSISSALCRVTAAVALSAPLAVLPATTANAATPWWCAPDAVLSVAALPDVLPASACSLAGRSVAGARGTSVAVPGVGQGATGTWLFRDASETVSVWTDEYGVHVRGDQYAAALGYLDAMRTSAAPAGDLARMAEAVRRVATLSVGIVRPQPVPTATLLDAADTVVAAYGGGSVAAADVAVARERLAAHLAPVVTRLERDDSPHVAELRAMADDVRAVLASGSADPVTTERVLSASVMLGSFLANERDAVADPAVPALRADVVDLTTAIRAGGHGAKVWSTAEVSYRFDTALANLSDYLAQQAPETPGLVPAVETPDLPEPAPAEAAGVSPPACEDDARRALWPDRAHWKRGGTIGWYYTNLGHYGMYNGDVYAAVAREAFDNVTRLNDDCGYGWRPNVANKMTGISTQTRPQYDGSVCAREQDHANVVGWRLFSNRAVGRACVWRSATAIVAFDVALNRDYHWDIPEYNGDFGYKACDPYQDEFDVENVLTHEFGHVVGLGHVSESNHANLTMSELVAQCGRRERTPGRGDAIGLAALYGRV